MHLPSYIVHYKVDISKTSPAFWMIEMTVALATFFCCCNLIKYGGFAFVYDDIINDVLHGVVKTIAYS
ncbi:MAG: hypothetical protein SNJ53_07695 [Thermodesulfovibrionales bacterium]